MHEKYMKMAIAKAREGRDSKLGGPFGAVIVKEDTVVCSVHNEVHKNGDLTQHAELLAIQKASQSLGKDALKDCVLYTSCEPCMMCMGACHWANFKAIYFGASGEDAKAHGFIYSKAYYGISAELRHNEFNMRQLLREEALEVWQET